ncbi:MAG: hypothetical protein ABI576_11255 [Flavobacterium sp.]
MKKLLLLLMLLFSFNFINAQAKPNIQIITTANIVGTCNNGTIITVKYYKDHSGGTNDKTLIIDTTKVKTDNKFNIKFSVERLLNDTIFISTDKTLDVQKLPVKVDYTVVRNLTTEPTSGKSNFREVVPVVNEYKAEQQALKNTTLTYGAQILSTNFSIPLVRFNFVTDDDTKQGDILLFTSIGAGVGYYWGQLERTRDNTGEIINEDFRNRFGINLGFLFSAGTGEDTKNVFAPVLNFAILDFQLGIGTELGTRSPNQKREFITLSYAIPMYKLFKKGYKIYARDKLPSELNHKTLN